MRSASRRALGTLAVLAVVDERVLDDAMEILEAEVASIDAACSRFRPDSELSGVNAAEGAAVRVGPLLFEALTVAVQAAVASDGIVDPTVGRTLRLTGYDRTFSVVAARAEPFRATFVRGPDWRVVELDEEGRTVRVPRGVELDLGATAKALAADRAAAAVSAATGTGTLVSLGGDLAVAGPAPESGWPIRIAEDNAAPLDTTGPVVSIAAGGVATSATTIRRWSTTSGELHHIVDPRTGRPASTYWRSATVSASSCVEANTASTAAIVLGESAAPWLDELRLPARLVRYDGAVCCFAGWPADAA
jgi:thiamine biosynthesis lipoprotein